MKSLFCAAILLASCASYKNQSFSVSEKQGIKGSVLLESGNRMPSPDEPLAEPKGIKTTVYIYEKTNISQVDRMGTGPLYTNIRTKLVQTVQTTKEGHFYAPLPVGTYSLFAKVNDLYYANHFDRANNIAVVEVTKDSVSVTRIKVNAVATY